MSICLNMIVKNEARVIESASARSGPTSTAGPSSAIANRREGITGGPANERASAPLGVTGEWRLR